LYLVLGTSIHAQDFDAPKAYADYQYQAERSCWRNLPRLLLLFLVVLFLVLMGTISAEKARLVAEKAASQAVGRKPVNTVLLELQPTTIQDAINLPGVIEPWTRLELLARLNGSIREVLVQEGSVVTPGQVIARIEEDDYRIALDSARAAHSRAKADYERKKIMLSKKTLPVADLELSEAQLLTAQAAMEDAELQLARCAITAPMGGVIRRLDAKVGLFLSVGDPVGEILEIDRVKAVAVDGILPTRENIKTQKYKLVRRFLLVSREVPTGQCQAFISFILSPQGQRLLEAEGLVGVK